MILVVTLMVAATIGVAVFWLAPRMGRDRVVFCVEPDRPLPFGTDTSWLAIRTSDTGSVIEALGLRDPQPSNWNSGLGSVYDQMLGRDHLFVSPPVEGWTFVVGLSLPQVLGPGFIDKCAPLLAGLAGRFDAVQYFLCYPEFDLFAWARFDGGRLVRAFAMTDVGVVWSRGRPTRPEQALGLSLYELRGVKERSGDAGGALIMAPTEDHVLNIAAAWSLDPTRLGQREAATGLGYLAHAPRGWSSERFRKSA